MFTPCDAWCKVFTGRSVHSRWVAEWLTLGAVNTELRACLRGQKMKNRTLFDFDLRDVHKSMWCVTMYSNVQFTGRCDAWHEHMVEMVQYFKSGKLELHHYTPWIVNNSERITMVPLWYIILQNGVNRTNRHNEGCVKISLAQWCTRSDHFGYFTVDSSQFSSQFVKLVTTAYKLRGCYIGKVYKVTYKEGNNNNFGRNNKT